MFWFRISLVSSLVICVCSSDQKCGNTRCGGEDGCLLFVEKVNRNSSSQKACGNSCYNVKAHKHGKCFLDSDFFYCACRGEDCVSKAAVLKSWIDFARNVTHMDSSKIKDCIKTLSITPTAELTTKPLKPTTASTSTTTTSTTSTTTTTTSTTTIRPLRTVGPKVVQQGVFEGETYESLMKRFEESKIKAKKNHKKTSGFTFKWWYTLMIFALLASIGLFGIVIWSAATRKKRCAEYWARKSSEEFKTGKISSAEKNRLDPVQRDAKMEVIPSKEIHNKGPIHLDKKFKGEMVHNLANEKSQSIHEKLEFVPQLNEEVEIGSDVDIIDGIEQVTCEDTVSVSRIDNFNTVRQATSTSTIETRKIDEKKP